MIEAGTTNDAIDITLSRVRKSGGIKLNIKVWPDVEAFFEHWSGGLQERPGHGRLWRGLDGLPIQVWGFGMQVNPSAARPYSLIHTGSGFYTDNGYPNISFLRAVGASAPEGRDIVIEALIGRGEIGTLAQRLSEACNLFYNEYLQQVSYRARVVMEQLAA